MPYKEHLKCSAVCPDARGRSLFWRTAVSAVLTPLHKWVCLPRKQPSSISELTTLPLHMARWNPMAGEVLRGVPFLEALTLRYGICDHCDIGTSTATSSEVTGKEISLKRGKFLYWKNKRWNCFKNHMSDAIKCMWEQANPHLLWIQNKIWKLQSTIFGGSPMWYIKKWQAFVLFFFEGQKEILYCGQRPKIAQWISPKRVPEAVVDHQDHLHGWEGHSTAEMQDTAKKKHRGQLWD